MPTTLSERIELISSIKNNKERKEEYNSLKNEIEQLPGHIKRQYKNSLEINYNKKINQ